MTPERDPRPRPQYGEYAEPATGAEADSSAGQHASDGADSTLSSATEGSARSAVQHGEFGEFAEDPQAPGAASPGAPATPAATPTASPVQSASGTQRLPGVPHNLGVKGASSTLGPDGVQGQGAPYRAAGPASPAQHAAGDPSAPTAPQQAQQTQLSQPMQHATPATAQPGSGLPQASARPRSNADRIITIALLALGAYFALSMAFSLTQFSAEFSKVATDLGIKDFTAPPQVKVIGTVGAILVLAIYALVLIFSVRRLRARKVTFWAPLVAGVLAWAVFFVLFVVGLSQSPDLWQELMRVAASPEEAQKLLEQLSVRP